MLQLVIIFCLGALRVAVEVVKTMEKRMLGMGGFAARDQLRETLSGGLRGTYCLHTSQARSRMTMSAIRNRNLAGRDSPEDMTYPPIPRRRSSIPP